MNLSVVYQMATGFSMYIFMCALVRSNAKHFHGNDITPSSTETKISKQSWSRRFWLSADRFSNSSLSRAANWWTNRMSEWDLLARGCVRWGSNEPVVVFRQVLTIYRTMCIYMALLYLLYFVCSSFWSLFYIKPLLSDFILTPCHPCIVRGKASTDWRLCLHISLLVTNSEGGNGAILCVSAVILIIFWD